MAKKTTPPARRAFAVRLKAVRISNGYDTARAFAVALGVEENRYTRWERAETEPGIELLLRICHLTGVTSDFLLMGKDPETAESDEGKKTTTPPHPTHPSLQNG